MTAPSLPEVSPSVQAAILRLGDSPVGASDVINAIFMLHREYGESRAGAVQIQPTVARPLVVGDWMHRIRELFEPTLVSVLHGRMVVIGLALLDQEIWDQIAPSGLLAAIQREILEPSRKSQVTGASVFEELLTETGRALWSARRSSAGTVVSFDHDTPAGRDLIGIDVERDAFAYLIASWQLDPPLAIGLFGDWGAGKTYFMGALRQQVDALSRRARADGRAQRETPFCKRIIQIEFNAWHYVEGNLWASLINHIFTGLQVEQGRSRPLIEERRTWLNAELDSTKQARRRGNERVRQLKDDLSRMNDEVERLKQEQQDKLAELERVKLADVIAVVELSPGDQQSINDALRDAGFGPVGHAAVDLLAAVQQAREALQRSSAVREFFRRGGTVATTALIVGLFLAPLVSWLLSRLDVTAVVNAAGTIATFVSVLAAALRYGAGKLNTAVERVTAANLLLAQRVNEAKEGYANRIADLEVRISELDAQRQDQLQQVQAHDREIERIENRLANLTPATVLAEFIDERLAQDDYRKHLGITSLVRQDLSQLSDLIFSYNEALNTSDSDQESTGGSKAFNRIVLYIDDLDRCPPETVMDVLQAVHLLLSFPLFVVVVAVDARWLSQSLTSHYRRLLVSEDADGMATPQDYLEKIFQIPFWVQPLGVDERRNLLNGLLGPRDQTSAAGLVRPASEGDAAAETGSSIDGANHADHAESADGPVLDPQRLMIDDIERVSLDRIIPLLGRSPRSVKRFVNVYRLVKSVALRSDPDFVSDEEYAGCEVAMLLLAVVTGMPAISHAFFRALTSPPAAGDPASTEIERILDEVEMAGRTSRTAQADLRRLRSWLKENPSYRHVPRARLLALAPLTSRFSFRLSHGDIAEEADKAGAGATAD